jgi:DNA-binding transcriptional regulator YiaG
MKLMTSIVIVDVDENNLDDYLRQMTPEQCRAARAWLNLSQEELAKGATVGVSTVRDFEAGRREPTRNNLAAIRLVLETAGIGFVDKEPLGITFKKSAKRH